MNRNRFARLAGFMFLFYIVTAFPAMVLFGQAAAGATIAERLASIAQNISQMHLITVLTLLTVFDALLLGTALYAITRDQDHDLALLALCCRVGEGITNVIPTLALLGLAAVAVTTEASASSSLGNLLLRIHEWSSIIGGSLFALGSLLFSYLFLRGRSVPAFLAWLGVASSAILVVILPAQLVGFVGGQVGFFIWIPMLIFEIVLGLWLLVKGIDAPGIPGPV